MHSLQFSSRPNHTLLACLAPPALFSPLPSLWNHPNGRLKAPQPVNSRAFIETSTLLVKTISLLTDWLTLLFAPCRLHGQRGRVKEAFGGFRCRADNIFYQEGKRCKIRPFKLLLSHSGCAHMVSVAAAHACTFYTGFNYHLELRSSALETLNPSRSWWTFSATGLANHHRDSATVAQWGFCAGSREKNELIHPHMTLQRLC